MDIFIPTYIQNCSHSFCYCCIIRWLNIHNSCPLCRKIISQIGYINPKVRGGKIIINAEKIKIKNDNIRNDCKDSVACIKCKKTEPSNKLLLCNFCKFNLTHLDCEAIEIDPLQNYICQDCREIKKNK